MNFFVIAKPNSPKTEIIEFNENTNTYKMNIHASPEKGKANQEIIKFFKKKLKKKVEIISGHTSRKKMIKVH